MWTIARQLPDDQQFTFTTSDGSKKPSRPSAINLPRCNRKISEASQAFLCAHQPRSKTAHTSGSLYPRPRGIRPMAAMRPGRLQTTDGSSPAIAPGICNVFLKNPVISQNKPFNNKIYRQPVVSRCYGPALSMKNEKGRFLKEAAFSIRRHSDPTFRQD
jgi:hypothetical protein